MTIHSPQRGKVDTAATRAALSGETGANIIRGYAGEQVLSSYAPVQVGETIWALIAEIDEDEAFSSIQALKYVMGILAFSGIAEILGLALGLSHVMVTPRQHHAVPLCRSGCDHRTHRKADS